MFTDYKSKLWIILYIIEIVCLVAQHDHINVKTISDGETYYLMCNNNKKYKGTISLKKNDVIITQSKKSLIYYIRAADILDVGDYSCYVEEDYLNTTLLNVVENEKLKNQKLWEMDNFGFAISENKTNQDERKIEIFETGIYCEEAPILRILESTLIGLQIKYENPKRCLRNHKQTLELECKYQNDSIVSPDVYKHTIAPFLSKILIPDTNIKECTSFYGNTGANNLTFSTLMSSNYFRVKLHESNFKSMSFSFDFIFFHNSKLRFYIYDLKSQKMHSVEEVISGKSQLYAPNLPKNSQYCLFVTSNEKYPFSNSIKCDIIIWTTHFARSFSNPIVILERTSHNVTVKWSDIYAPKLEKFKVTGFIVKYEPNKYTNKTNPFSNGNNFIIYSNHSDELLQFTINNLFPSTFYTINFKYKFENQNFFQKVTGIKFKTKYECQKINISLNTTEDYIMGRITPHQDYINIINGYILTVTTSRYNLRFHMNKNETIFILYIHKIKHKLSDTNITVVFENQSCTYIYKYNIEINTHETNEFIFFKSLFRFILSNLGKVIFTIFLFALLVFIDQLMTGDSLTRNFESYSNKSYRYENKYLCETYSRKFKSLNCQIDYK